MNKSRTLYLLSHFLVLSLLSACGRVNFEQVQSKSTETSPDPLRCNQNCPTPVSVHENYAPNTSKAIDILFTIDNSGSMTAEQQAMSQRLSAFTGKIQGFDWQIAVTSTDVSSDSYGQGIRGRLYSFNASLTVLTPNVPDFAQLFAQRVNLGADGDGAEAGINASLYAIERNESNWIRPSAHLAIVVLSDENENSTGTNLTARNQPQNLVSQVVKRFGKQKGFSFHSVVILDETCRATQAAQKDRWGKSMPAHIGTQYMAASDLTGGIKGSICSSDYSNELARIGDRIVNSTRAHVLQCLPLAGTLIVRDSAQNLVAAHAEGNRLVLDQTISEGTTLTVDYQCPGA